MQRLIVRTRAKEIVELLADLDRVRNERRKAKANRNKYIGTGNDSMNLTSGRNRYGGFGSESAGGASGYSGGDAYDNDGESRLNCSLSCLYLTSLMNPA
jgi:epsin